MISTTISRYEWLVDFKFFTAESAEVVGRDVTLLFSATSAFTAVKISVIVDERESLVPAETSSILFLF